MVLFVAMAPTMGSFSVVANMPTVQLFEWLAPVLSGDKVKPLTKSERPRTRII